VTATSFRIRRIGPDDGLILRDLRLRSLADAPEAFGQRIDEARGRPTVEWHESARQSSHGDGRTWLLAEREGDAVGLVQGRRRRPSTLLLFSMWVDPSARRQSVGLRLIKSLEEWAGGWDARDTVLWAYGGNVAAIRFYRDLGFDALRDGPDAEAGARFGALAMRRAIHDSPTP
jgi:GNAT superfamily N-acetyltransferase